MERNSQLFLNTNRLKIAYYRAGEAHADKLLLLHGNLSSSVFFLPLLPVLSQQFDVVAPDLRCFGDTEDRPVDAVRGYRDWSDDVDALLDALGWEKASVGGWSMGGNVAMQYAIDHPHRVNKLVLIAPGPPFGFGGTRDPEGIVYDPPGLGSGGGCVNPLLLSTVKTQGEFLLHPILHHFYFTASHYLEPGWEALFVEGVQKTRLGREQYPGDFRYSFRWPFVAAGDHGILNAMSPLYGNLSGLVEIADKPPILWIRGRDDVVVSDHSMFDFGYLGMIGTIPGWPGPWVYPPQPMLAQTRYLLERYREKGGNFQEVVIPGGHACHLESPGYFVPLVCSFLLE